ncbi:MAG: hypothetical protein KIC52_10435 [Firmicutes bacterium]|nr:hypothetical protein [Bacillota bacterium]
MIMKLEEALKALRIVFGKTISFIWALPKQTRRLQRKYRSVSRLERNRKNPGIMKIRYIDLVSSVCHVATTD